MTKRPKKDLKKYLNRHQKDLKKVLKKTSKTPKCPQKDLKIQSLFSIYHIHYTYLFPLQSTSKNGIKKDLLFILSQKNTKEESEFLKKLISFMECRNTPIERPPMLGYKQSKHLD